MLIIISFIKKRVSGKMENISFIKKRVSGKIQNTATFNF